MRIRPGLPAILAGALLCLPLMWTASRAENPRPVVVELFTSQGCSSCPPAEVVLGELVGMPNVLALAYHVDYWDDLGWRDSFSSPVATRRQQQYSKALRLNGVFTPQMVVDGKDSLIGSNRPGVLKAIREARSGMKVDIRIDGDALTVTLPARDDHLVYEVAAISYVSEAATAVPRGENAGRTLREFNIVRSVHTLGSADGTTKQFKLKVGSLPVDASRIAILVQEPAAGRIVGAASAALR